MHNHPKADVLDYTPRQMSAWLTLGRRRQRREKRDQLGMMTAAFRASPEDLRRLLRENE